MCHSPHLYRHWLWICHRAREKKQGVGGKFSPCGQITQWPTFQEMLRARLQHANSIARRFGAPAVRMSSFKLLLTIWRSCAPDKHKTPETSVELYTIAIENWRKSLCVMARWKPQFLRKLHFPNCPPTPLPFSCPAYQALQHHSQKSLMQISTILSTTMNKMTGIPVHWEFRVLKIPG